MAVTDPASDSALNSASIDSSVAASLAVRLTEWQRKYGRHHLPWQKPRSDYRVWLSEVMLQQTQVATVIPYFERFLRAFPSLQALAAAPSEQVMEQWSGLGYYSRARNLHRCAQLVVEHHGGKFPCTREALMSLPGIGRSTAAAIMVFAHGQRDAILDGNVKRVFCRHFGITGVPDSAPVLRQLWPVAERELAERNVVAYTQGLMDLGATICLRTKPDCDRCPIAGTCQAFQQDRVHELPTRRKRASLPQRQTTVLVLLNERREVLLQLRPDTGIWGGLLSLPESGLPPDSRSIAHLQDCGLGSMVAQSGHAGMSGPELAPINHTFTHFKLTLRPVVIRVSASMPALNDSTAGLARFVSLSQIETAALPRPIKTLLTRVSQSESPT